MWNRMIEYLSPPAFEGDEDKTRVAGLVNAIVLTTLVVMALYASVALLLSPGRAYRVIFVAPMFPLLLAMLPLIRRGQVYLASTLLITGVWLFATVEACINGGVRAPIFGGYTVVVLAAGLLLRRRAAFVFAGLSLLAGLAMVYAQAHGTLPASDLIDLPMTAWMTHAALLSVAVALLSLATRSIDGALARARQELAKRRQAEAALQESESKFRSIVEQSSDGIMLLDEQGTMIEYNSALERITGVRRERALGTAIWDFQFQLVPDERKTPAAYEAGQSALLQVLTTGQSPLLNRTIETVVQRADGTRRSVSQTLFTIQTDQGFRLAGISRDTTERKRAELVQAATYRVSEAAQAARNLQELYRSIHAIIGELMPAKNFYIALYDASTDLLSFPYYADEFDAAWPPQKPGRGLTEHVLRTGKSLLATPPVYEQLEKAGEVVSIGTPSVDWLGVPLRTGNETIGVMAVQTYNEAERLGRADKDVLVFVSTQVAMVIERKRAEEALRESEQLYRSLINVMPEGMALSDISGNITFVSPQLLAIYGVTSAQDALGTNALQWIAPESHEKALTNIQSLVSNEAPFDHEYVLLRKDGTRFLGEISGALLTDDKGNPKGLVTVHRDITERKQAEEALRQSESLYHRAIEAAGAVPYCQDYGLEAYSFMGEGIWRLTGYASDEMTPDLWRSLVLDLKPLGEASGLDRQEAVRRARAGEFRIWQCDVHVRTRDGQTRWVTDSAVEMRDEQGVLRGSIGILQDITERKRAEEALQESEERYRTLFEDSPVSLWEEDFSAAKTYIDRLRDAGIQDLGSYFENHPEAVKQCVDMVRVIDVNKAALEWHHVASKDALLACFRHRTTDLNSAP